MGILGVHLQEAPGLVVVGIPGRQVAELVGIPDRQVGAGEQQGPVGIHPLLYPSSCSALCSRLMLCNEANLHYSAKTADHGLIQR